MEINEKMLALGSKRSIIREIFEFSKKRASEIGAENVYNFSLGNPSVDPPEQVNQAIKELLDTTKPSVMHGYTSAQGDLGVRQGVADYINERFNLSLTANNIYMTCGAAASLTISLKAVMNEGEECIVFAPYFTEYKVFIENAGGKIVVSKPNMDNFFIDFEDFESKINEKTRAVIVNSPNNPSGVVYPKEDLIRLGEILNKKSLEYGKVIYLIADEPYRELVYTGVEVPYLMNYYKNSIVCYSYSKSLSLPGERIGYIAVNPEMQNSTEVYLAVCGAGRSLGYVCAPALFQQLVLKCLRLTSDVNIYKENRDLLYNSLESFGFKCVRPDGAFYLFVKTPEEDAYKFYEKAKEKEILVVPCDDFGVKGYVRIAYCVDKKTIENSLPAFEKLAKEYGINK